MSKEGFANRWSRLKQQQRAEKQLPVEEEQTLTEEELQQQKEAINELTDNDMPSLDSLNESSDYGIFLSEKVSEQVRKAALRKMFHMPGLNIVDGLDDYDEDYTTFEVLGDIITHDMKRMAKVEEQREKEKQMQAEAEAKERMQAENEELEQEEPVAMSQTDDETGYEDDIEDPIDDLGEAEEI
ncbi:MAG: DUF3306 domain-containing protein [Gammaproteobacteria bacterium]|nr:DUF3306 domain-containing protein [Gammaproteobacteria bacterium]